MTEPADTSLSPAQQRIDKWLWHARIVRTRSAAAALASAGMVRINGVRVRGPAQQVRIGEVITVALDSRVQVLKVLAISARRGGAADARRLYEDMDESRD
jgi:ribosome-associated heat shock protein Hsp15